MTKRNTIIIANTVLIILIIIGFFWMQLNDFIFYRQIATEQAKNDVMMSAMDINSEITLLSDEQMVVSQMMANDIFLKKWCEDETGDGEDAHSKQLYEYLATYKEKYDYDVIFFVSNKTYNYYYNGGLNKVISPGVEFDKWYFNFIDLNKEYDIQIDHDEVNRFSVSLFVNCLVQDDEGNILGVVGAGEVIDDFQSILENIVDSLDVDICIVNMGNAHNSFSGSTGFYKNPEDAAASMKLSLEDVTKNVGVKGEQWVEHNKSIIVMNNPALNWNIIVQKNLAPAINNMMKRSYGRVALMFAVIIIYIVVSSKLLSNLRKIEIVKENTDELTGLINKKLFEARFEMNRGKHFWGQNISLFILDVDNFKHFNDNYGHLYGNTVLRTMAATLKEEIGVEGEVARWGGDEFVGVLFCQSYLAKTIMEAILDEVRIKDAKSPITFSCGIIDCDSKLTLDEMLEQADKALYESKEKGKAQVSVYKG